MDQGRGNPTELSVEGDLIRRTIDNYRRYILRVVGKSCGTPRGGIALQGAFGDAWAAAAAQSHKVHIHIHIIFLFQDDLGNS